MADHDTDTPDDPTCSGCGGRRRRSYGSTATYHGGIGGQMMTDDICDKCWGSGDDDNPGPNLKMLAIRARDDTDVAFLLREVADLRRLLGGATHRVETATGKPWVAHWHTPPDDRTRAVLLRAGIGADPGDDR